MKTMKQVLTWWNSLKLEVRVYYILRYNNKHLSNKQDRLNFIEAWTVKPKKYRILQITKIHNKLEK